MMTPMRKGAFALAIWAGCAATLAQTNNPASRPATAPAESAPGYWLRVKSDRVNLRSRPDTNSLIVAQMKRNARLRGMNSEFGWHRVLPPAGAFCYVSADHIRRQGEDIGEVAVINGQLRVRAGSLLADVDPANSELQTLLSPGAMVKIIGQSDNWLKIVPPEGVYFYISADYVETVDGETAAPPQASQPADVSKNNERRAESTAPRPEPNTAPRVETNLVPPASNPASQPAQAVDLSGTWGRRLEALEAAIRTETGKPALERSWGPLIADLKPLVAQREEPLVARLADGWITQLEQRIADQELLRTMRQIAEREAREGGRFASEIERIRRAQSQPASPQAPPAPVVPTDPAPLVVTASPPVAGGPAVQNDQPAFDARGELQSSYVLRSESRQQRYALKNPSTYRVKIYLDFPADTKIDVKSYVGKYVGVRGQKAFDSTIGTEVIRVSEIVDLGKP